MIELLWKYIIGPIIADAKGAETLTWKGATATVGYNPINTIFYVLLASAVIYSIYRLFQRKNIEFTPQTAVYSTPFILLGGTLRFLDDAQLIPYPYSIPLITPLIYFLIAAVFIPAVYKLEDRQITYLGTALLTPSLLFAFLSFQSFNLIYAAGVLTLTAFSTIIYYLLMDERYTESSLVLLAFTQFFEGAASMLSSFYGYDAKQLLAQVFNSLIGFPGVFVMKVGVLALALQVVTDIEDEVWRALALVVLYSVGLGTGFRVFLRVVAGV